MGETVARPHNSRTLIELACQMEFFQKRRPEKIRFKADARPEEERNVLLTSAIGSMGPESTAAVRLVRVINIII